MHPRDPLIPMEERPFWRDKKGQRQDWRNETEAAGADGAYECSRERVKIAHFHVRRQWHAWSRDPASGCHHTTL